MKSAEQKAFRFPLTDVHCHILPGVDDGASSMEVTAGMLEQAYRDGIRTMIVTPHFRMGMFETPGTRVREAFRETEAYAQAHFPEMKLVLGCEFHAFSEMEEALKANPRFRLGGAHAVLLEFSGGDTPSYIRDRVLAAQRTGCRVVIAHAERYAAIQQEESLLRDLVRMGAEIQVNADSLLGFDGWGIKRFSGKLLEKGLVSYIGSDAHNTTNRPNRLAECARYVEKKYGPGAAERIFSENPETLLRAVLRTQG